MEDRNNQEMEEKNERKRKDVYHVIDEEKGIPFWPCYRPCPMN